MAVSAVHFAMRITVSVFLILLVLPPAGNAADAEDHAISYTVREGDTLLKICNSHRHLTNHYSLTDLLTAIRLANGLESNFLRIGQTLQIPVRQGDDFQSVDERVSDGAEMRGIYLTGPACGVSSVLTRVDRFIEAGGNAVVFDAKDIDGGVSFFSRHELSSWGAGRTSPIISSLEDMMYRFDQRGLYVVARIALFLDGELGLLRPDLALQDSLGAAWTERGCVWIDPANPEAIEYNLALAGELARAGVDEIQFDYVRFPTNGWQGDWQGSPEATAARRQEVIAGFLTAARDTLDDYGVRISADLYGIMAWNQMEDLALTGQHVPTIASLVDVVCPMIYPSHFKPGFEGRKRPGDDPAYFIAEGTRRFLNMAAGQAEVRPWLQAFPYRVTNFDSEYIETQVLAAREAGGRGWSLWNPSCRYDVALEVIPSLCAGPVVSLGMPASADQTVVSAAPGPLTSLGQIVRRGSQIPVPDPHPDDVPEQ